jgi:AraC-like DNA-binding protein
MPETRSSHVAEVPGSPDIVQLSSTDVDHARTMLNRFYHPVAIGVPEGPHSFELELEVIRLGPLTVGQLHFGAPVTLVAAELDGYHVTLPTTGRVVTRQAGNETVATRWQAAVFRPSNPVYTVHDRHSAEFDVKINEKALTTELSALLGHSIDDPIDLSPAMDLATGPGRSWSRLVRLICDEMPYPDSLIHQPLIAEQVRHSLLNGLLLSVRHRYHEELTAPAPPGAPRAIRRAMEAIRAEPEKPFSAGDLAEVAGMSVRSLQEGFRRHVGRTPIAYLQEVRLARVHEALRSADPALTTVTAVAHRWGFAHLGRFASAYRSRFGVSPSQTLRDGS